MAFESAQSAGHDGSWGTIAALVAADGSANHPEAERLRGATVAIRDLTDTVHAICMLHGRHPGVIDHAVTGNDEPAAQPWLVEAADGFSAERAYIAQLAAAAGPLPSTPGQAESEAAIVAQSHALDMLAQSDRTGCAIGAAIALVLDWAAVRTVLDNAAYQFGVDVPELAFPIEVDTATLVAALAENPAVERAMAFGAQQVIAQHRGLWDLLAARAEARNHA